MQKALGVILAEFSVFESDFFPFYPLSDLTTLRIGGPCRMLAVPKSEAVLLRLLSLLDEAGIPRVILGNGSNILAPDEGYRGVVIRTTALRDVYLADGGIHAACGTPLSAVIRVANKAGIGGLASLAGIPATVGGAVFMNAGAFGACIGDAVSFVRAAPQVGGTALQLLGSECLFSYRRSIFQSHTLPILSACFTGPEEAPDELCALSATALRTRRERHPTDLPNAGSIFRRPREGEAWRLIERAGLRGACVGGAMVSQKHAGFIVNAGGATAKDVRTLIARIQTEVYERTGILLAREIEYLGE